MSLLSKNKMKSINVDELKEKFDKQEEFTVLDVRFEGELYHGKIKFAIVIPFPELAEKLHLLNKEDEIIVYCRTQTRSQRAVQYLESQGFSNVSFLEGGILAWKKYDPSIEEY